MLPLIITDSFYLSFRSKKEKKLDSYIIDSFSDLDGPILDHHTHLIGIG